MDTREKILTTALELFSQNGYEGVSVSEIAQGVGVTKGALYRHYQSKQHILDSIVQHMYALDEQRAQAFGMPAHPFDEEPDAYLRVTRQWLEGYTLAQFDYWTQDGFTARFRRLLTLEQYRSPRMAQLYHACLVEGPVAYMTDVFAGMMEAGVMAKGDPHAHALAYYAPLWLLICAADAAENVQALRQTLKTHVQTFLQQYSINE